ncbi:MAG: ImmA/IrrE family metallo-endopeptidase [Clostridiaceae bacterium]|nr:ImmA/IrrE family metallo-endopeptidase [Clostridiaceae bacterium]
MSKTTDQLFFPIVEFIELILPKIDPGFELEILTREEMGTKHGLTLPDKKCIRLREDVYIRACNNEGRDRLTLAHEVGHYFLHDSSSVQHARLQPGEEIKAFEDPEWQASAFAGELLVPAHLAKGLRPADIAYMCGVSNEAALMQYNKIPGNNRRISL